MSGETSAVAELRALIAEGAAARERVRGFLDALESPARVEVARSLGRSEQRRLYVAVDGFLPLRLVDLVPADRPDLEPVRHFGRNSLPAFTHFEKRFCRPPGADSQKPAELYGFNFQALAPLTGPGYFVAHEDAERSEVWVDYNRLPREHPQGWPSIRPNDRGFSRFVYGFMIDTLRRVSEHVTIGSAARKGRDMGSWFVLCRES